MSGTSAAGLRGTCRDVCGPPIPRTGFLGGHAMCAVSFRKALTKGSVLRKTPHWVQWVAVAISKVLIICECGVLYFISQSALQIMKLARAVSLCVRQNNGFQICEPFNPHNLWICYLICKRNIVDVIMLKSLRWGDYPGLACWAWSNHQGFCKWKVGKGEWMTE